MRGIGINRRIGVGVLSTRGGGGVVCNGAGQSFNGTDQYAYVADNGALDIVEATTDLCLSAHFTANPSGNFEYIVGKNVSSAIQGRFGFRKNSSNLVQFQARFGDFDSEIDTSIDASTDTDSHHYLARFDLANKKIYVYVDGVLQNAGGTSYTSTSESTSNDIKFLIGNSQNSTGVIDSFWANSIVKDVRIYHKDVTPDLTDLMAGKALGDEVAWWCLPELTGYGGTDYDLTGVNL